MVMFKPAPIIVPEKPQLWPMLITEFLFIVENIQGEKTPILFDLCDELNIQPLPMYIDEFGAL